MEYKPVPPEDAEKAYAIEVAGFPEDEAASLEALVYRIANAPEYFLGAYKDGQLIGYVCSTLTHSDTLTHDSMSMHEPDGAYVAIHSVSVAKQYQRQGHALRLLEAYLARVTAYDNIKGLRLIAHEELVPLYQKAGFTLVGKSSVAHGSLPWYELKYDTFAPIQSVSSDLASLVDANGRNAFDLYCPRTDCRCKLVEKGIATLVPGSSSAHLLPEVAQWPSSYDSSLEKYQKTDLIWNVPSPLDFYNIGFSKNDSNAKKDTIKYLICADCDLGPLGLHDTEGRDLGREVELENEKSDSGVRTQRQFLLHPARVRYV